MFLAGIISVLMTHFRSYNELFACFVLYGVMDGTIVSSLNILALYTLSPEERPQGFGFFHLCIAFSLAAGPPFGGMYELNTRQAGGGGGEAISKVLNCKLKLYSKRFYSQILGVV